MCLLSSLAQLGLQVVQIGDNPEASEFLRSLDNDLCKEHHCRDIVDTTHYTGVLNEDVLCKMLLGGINRRVDRSGE